MRQVPCSLFGVEHVGQPQKSCIGPVQIIGPELAANRQRFNHIQRVPECHQSADSDSSDIQGSDKERCETADARIFKDEQRCGTEIFLDNLPHVRCNLVAACRRELFQIEPIPVMPRRAEVGQKPFIIFDKSPWFPVSGRIAGACAHQPLRQRCAEHADKTCYGARA